MSFTDLFRVKKIKAENEQLKAKMSALEKTSLILALQNMSKQKQQLIG